MKTEKVRMVTLRQMYYDRDLETGEEFDATPDHAALLARVGSAKRVDEAAKAEAKKYDRRDMRAKD